MNRKLASVLCAGILGLGGIGSAVLASSPAEAIALPQPVPTQRIEFAPGATSAVIRNNGNNYPQRYVIRANAGQVMNVQVDSPDNITLSIVGADGRVLLPQPVETSNWSGRLPTTEDYYIWLYKPQGATYTLSVNIPPANTPASMQRVQFQPGTTSTVLSGNLAPHTSQSYLVGAREGQYTSVQVNSSNNADFLTMYGKDGTVLTNGNMSGSTVWSGRLPQTEDYIVEVTNPTASSTHYVMPISIQ